MILTNFKCNIFYESISVLSSGSFLPTAVVCARVRNVVIISSCGRTFYEQASFFHFWLFWIILFYYMYFLFSAAQCLALPPSPSVVLRVAIFYLVREPLVRYSLCSPRGQLIRRFKRTQWTWKIWVLWIRFLWFCRS